MKKQIPPKLLKLYHVLENQGEVLRAIKEGRKEFIKDVKKAKLGGMYSKTSKVHHFDDVEVQAVVVAIGTSGGFKEMVSMAYLAYAGHFIDDFFDRPDLEPSVETLRKYRRNVERLFDNTGPVGKFGYLMARRVKHIQGLYKAVQRLAYGGLIQLSENSEEQDVYLKEYKEIGLKGINKEVKAKLSKIRDIPYWMTAKTTLELFSSVEKDYSPTISELWNLVYCPGLFFHDIEEEKKSGEVNFFNKKLPSINEMEEMIKIATEFIKKYESNPYERLTQLRFFTLVFGRVLPKEITEAYKSLEQELVEMIK